jgi:hypothetical protein
VNQLNEILDTNPLPNRWAAVQVNVNILYIGLPGLPRYDIQQDKTILQKIFNTYEEACDYRMGSSMSSRLILVEIGGR